MGKEGNAAMSDASEFLQWQENSRKHLTERQPEPLVMTDSEIVEWLDEYASVVVQQSGYRSRFEISVDGMSVTTGETLRQTVKLAAAKMEELNS
jgi:hypothetical protein